MKLNYTLCIISNLALALPPVRNKLTCRNKKINSNKTKKKQMLLSARKASVKLILTVGIFVRSKQDFSARISVIFRESAD